MKAQEFSTTQESGQEEPEFHAPFLSFLNLGNVSANLQAASIKEPDQSAPIKTDTTQPTKTISGQKLTSASKVSVHIF